MDRSSVVYLIKETHTPDKYGVMQYTATKRKVFCQVISVSLSEWSDGARLGLNPEFRISMFSPEYHGEQVLEFEGKTYTIYRTYRAKNEILDLYVQRRQGDANITGVVNG